MNQPNPPVTAAPESVEVAFRHIRNYGNAIVHAACSAVEKVVGRESSDEVRGEIKRRLRQEQAYFVRKMNVALRGLPESDAIGQPPEPAD